MNRLEMHQIFSSAAQILKSPRSDEEKVNALKKFIDDAHEEMIYGTRYEDVRGIAKELVSRGYTAHIKALLQIINVQKLEQVQHDFEVLQALYEILKILKKVTK